MPQMSDGSVKLKLEEDNLRWAEDVSDISSGEVPETVPTTTVTFPTEQKSIPPKPTPRPRPRFGELWPREEITQGLKKLPGADHLLLLMATEETDVILEQTHLETAVLLAAWQGNDKLLGDLIQAGPTKTLLESTDADGRSALHLAAFAGSASCVSLLLHAGASERAWDAAGRATPLHCAASAGSVACLRLLLAAGVDVNAGLQAGCRSPLHCAVLSDAPDCVRKLLAAGACPNTPQVYTETPLHVAASMGYCACAKLLLDHGADVRVAVGAARSTPLHLAAEDGNADCVRLLLDAGADPNVASRRRQTPLHLAALAQSSSTLELLLQRGADPNSEDEDGRTPLHAAIVKVSRSCDCVRVLLDAGAQVNRADHFGYTPLHLAALNEFSSCAALLIGHGADVTARTNGGVTALTFLVRRTPDVLASLLALLDRAVSLHDHELGDVDCELKLDFRVLVPSSDRGESGLLLAFIEVGLRHLLKHPLCEAFLCLKWRRIRKYFLFSLLFHTLFVLVYSTYVVTSNPKLYPLAQVHVPVGYIMMSLNFLLVAKEIFQMAHNCSTYLRTWENWLQWLIIITAFLCLGDAVSKWRHHVAAVGIFLTWLELMLLVGRFPVFGLYVQMFTTVAVNFGKFLMAYCCLLIAFSLSFVVLFYQRPPFGDVFLSLLKTIVMMSGELEFEDIFYTPDQPIQYPGTAHLLFLAFVLLVTVILANLLVGLAVSDIQGLQRSAGLDRLVRQAQLVAHLESMLFSRLLLWMPPRLLAFLHRNALLLISPYHWALHVRPNHPQADRVPMDIVRDAYHLVAERRRYKRADSVFVTPDQDDLCALHRIGSLSDPNLSQTLSQIKALFVDIQKERSISDDRFNQLATQIRELQQCVTQLKRGIERQNTTSNCKR